MKKIILTIVYLLCLSTILSAKSNLAKLPLSQSLPILQEIKNYSIKIGSGKSEIYVFVDPLCPHSRDFMDLIIHSKKMQSRYSYYVFLYELERFNSLEVIEDIYASESILLSLKKVMLDNHTFKGRENISAEVKEKIQKISQSAQKLHINKRPYLIINKIKKRGK